MSRLLCAAALLVIPVDSCSNFAMENDYLISARTEDLGPLSYDFALVTRPKGERCLRSCQQAYVAVVPMKGRSIQDTQIKAGMNAAGLSCDKQTLLGSQYPERNESLDNIDAAFLCQWALEGHSSVIDLKLALHKVNFVTPEDPNFLDGHWVLRDALGQGIVLEFLEGHMLVYDDNNDQGSTGFGILTNEPPFTWQLQAVRHLQWKQSLARPALAMPGSWYPEERFQRIYLVKSGMPKPTSYEEAVTQATHVMNTISVPVGMQIGTDSRRGEGLADRTHWGVIYDHRNRTLYWRTQGNQNLQRLRLADASLREAGPGLYLRLGSPALPWFHDAAGALAPAPAAQRGGAAA